MKDSTRWTFDDDERDYGIAVRMLQMLACTRVRLMTNNPSKLDGLSRVGKRLTRSQPEPAVLRDLLDRPERFD